MTAIVTQVTITSTTYDALSTTLGVIAIMLLIALLALKELTRAYGGPRSGVWVQTLNIAILPLLLTFGLTIVMRLVHILSIG